MQDNSIPEIICPHCGKTSYTVAITESELREVLQRRVIKEEENKMITAEDILNDEPLPEINVNYAKFMEYKPSDRYNILLQDGTQISEKKAEGTIDGITFKGINTTLYNYAGKYIEVFNFNITQEHVAVGFDVNMYKVTTFTQLINSSMVHKVIELASVTTDAIKASLQAIYIEDVKLRED